MATSKRARWGARHLLHDVFEDGYPLLRQRYAKERVAAGQKYEYNLGTRSFDDADDAEDGMAWLRALFVELDGRCDNKNARENLRRSLDEELPKWRIAPAARQARKSKLVTFTAPGSLGMDLKSIDSGVAVVDVARGGPADLAGIKPNDLITKVNDLPGSVLRAKSTAMASFQPRPLHIHVSRTLDDDCPSPTLPDNDLRILGPP